MDTETTPKLKFNKLFLGILLLILGISSFLATALLVNYFNELSGDNSQQGNTNEGSEETLGEETLENEPFGLELDPNYEITEAAWLPDWAGKAGLDSLKNNLGRFDNINPVWYEVNTDGSLKKKLPSNANAIKAEAAKQNIKLIPTIALFDDDLLSDVLENQGALDNHVNSIVAEVTSNGYAGIDLDYESTELEDKEKFFEFLEKLSDKMHAENKTLIFTVLAQWENNTGYKSFKETRKVQEWERIAPLVDEVRIMTYDYTSFKSLYPGPIAPINWMQEVLDYAVKYIPRNKIVLGVHLYSYEWWIEAEEIDKYKNEPDYNDPLAFMESSDLNLPLATKKTRSYTYSTNANQVQNNKGELKDFQGEKIFRYRRQNPDTGVLEERVLVYIDKGGVAQRKQLAREYGIKGVAYWRLGGDGDILHN